MPQPQKISLRSFWEQLSVPARWLLSTTAFSTIGRGLTLPFTIIYVNEVRGIDLDVAGALMGIIAVVALVVTGPIGSLVDRIGARQVLLWGNVIQVAATALLAFATTVPTFIVAFTLLGISFGAGWPAFQSMIAALVDGPLRTQFFGINFAMLNLGIGIGGVVGGLIADVHRPGTFMALFLGDSLGVCIPIALLMGPLRHVHARAEAPAAAVGADRIPTPASYLAILRQPGFAFAVNTAVIVLAQFFVLSRIVGRRRTRVYLVLIGLWAVAWTIMGLTGLAPGTLAAAIGVCLFHVFFGIGETMLNPTMPAIVNDLASDHTRGRYNATTALAFQLGAIAAPVSAGLMLDHGLGGAFIGTLLAGLAVMVVLTRQLERRLSPAVNGILTPTEAASFSESGS